VSYPFLKFLHVASMFLATALAVGPSALLFSIARTGDAAAVRRAFGAVPAVFRGSAACYGLGILFGVAAALTGQLDFTARWLLVAYLLVGLLIVVNLGFERWSRRVEAAAAQVEPGSDPQPVSAMGLRRGAVTLAAMVVVTVLIVFVMVVKPSLG
jgi:hypothetical protein